MFYKRKNKIIKKCLLKKQINSKNRDMQIKEKILDLVKKKEYRLKINK